MIFQTQSTVYEIVSDLSGRQDHLEDRLTAIEEKLTLVHDQLLTLPELISRSVATGQQQQPCSSDAHSKNLLRPEYAALSSTSGTSQSHNLSPHSKSVPPGTGPTKTLLPATAPARPT